MSRRPVAHLTYETQDPERRARRKMICGATIRTKVHGALGRPLCTDCAEELLALHNARSGGPIYYWANTAFRLVHQAIAS